MDELIIKLKDGIEPLKEIYFADGKGSIFSYKPTKRSMVITVVMIVFSAFLYLLSFTNQITWIVLFVMSSLTTVIFAIVLILQGKRYFKWKTNIDAYLKLQAKSKNRIYTLTENTLQCAENNETTIEKWDTIKHISIHQSHIYLTSIVGTNYVFPLKSMEPEEYLQLEAFIRNKMNQNDPSVQQPKVPAL